MLEQVTVEILAIHPVAGRLQELGNRLIISKPTAEDLAARGIVKIIEESDDNGERGEDQEPHPQEVGD